MTSDPRHALFGLLYGQLHQYPHIGRRLAFALAQRRTRSFTFAELQPWIIGIDALLSTGRQAARGGRLLGAALAPLTFGASLAAAKLWSALFRRLDAIERSEAFRVLLQPMETGRINAGSAKLLRGRVVVGHAFVDGPGVRAWSRARKRRVRRRADRAMAWLRQQASQHGVPLQFSSLELGDIRLDSDGLTTARWGPDDPIELLQQRDEKIWAAADKGKLSAMAGDHRCVLVHGPQQLLDTSWARPAFAAVGLPYASRETSEQIEYAIVRETASATVHAHELLHLFGADDQYGEGANHDFRGSFLQRSIMFSASGGLDQRVLDGTTAQLIGWR
jgi:hypothetical protein